MKRHCSLMILFLFLLMLPAFVVRAKPAAAVPPEISGLEVREAVIILEGQAETVLQSRYRDHFRHFALWYETQNFSPYQTAHGTVFTLADNRLGAPVCLTIESTDSRYGGNLPDLEDIRNTYEQDGWVCEPLDTANLLPGFQLPGQPPQAFIAYQSEQITRVILTQAGSGQYLITLTYPQEAAEGWGARMLMMMNTLENLPAE